MTSPPDLSQLPGLVATVVTTGHVDDQFMHHWSNLRSWCDRRGWHKIEWRPFYASLVEQGRDDVARHALKEKYEWVLQIDADAAPFPEDALARLLHDAYVAVPDADVVGAYCQLKGNYLPTIDTGTGTWEVHYPGEGILPVIRTGGHFHLTKTQAYRKIGPNGPWYRTRQAMSPARALAEVDNFARQILHGENPLTETEAWQKLIEVARTDPKWVGQPGSPVGEDSSFCDALRAAGGRIYVDTDLVAGHVAKEVILPSKLKEAMEKKDRIARLACGVYE